MSNFKEVRESSNCLINSIRPNKADRSPCYRTGGLAHTVLAGAQAIPVIRASWPLRQQWDHVLQSMVQAWSAPAIISVFQAFSFKGLPP